MFRQTPRPVLLHYGCALLTVALVIICRSLLQPVLVEQAPLLLFTLAVMTSAWYGGLGPGLLATSLSTFAGVYFFMEPMHSLVIYDPKDKAVMALFVITGVMISLLSQSLHSSRRRVEESARKLRASEDRYRRIVETAGEGIWMIDHEARTSFVNLRMAEMLGYAREEMLGKSSFEHIFDEDKAEALRRFENKREGDGSPSDFRFRRRDGSEIWVRVSTSSIFDDDGALLGVLGMFTGITERRRAEMERAELLVTAQEARAEAERANNLKDEFLATVSHELRTPLASMLMWTRMLASGNLDAETSVQAHTTLIGNIKLLSQLIEDLLDVSRIVSGKLRIESRSLQIIPVLEAAIEVVRPAAEAKNIKIETAFDLSAGEVLADANRLQQVFWNLLSNAIKFTASGGSVRVKLECVSSQVQVTVSDTGIGIREEFLPHIFERFYQGGEDGGRRGLGLGLAIARHLVDLHGGSIEAESEGEGRGATFTVRLPLIVDK